MGKVIAVANRKGGSGKTSTAVHLASGLAVSGRRVLLVDADPQAHASMWLSEGGTVQGRSAVNSMSGDLGLYALLTSESDLHAVAETVSVAGAALDVLKASPYLVRYETERSSRRGEAHVMSRCLAPYLEDYDFVILDTPPTVGLLLISALTAAQWVFIPLPMQYLALEGLEEMIHLLARIRGGGNSKLTLKGVIPMFHDQRLRISADVKKSVVKLLGRDIFLPSVRSSVKLAEAPGFGKTIFEYAPSSPVAHDWKAVIKAVSRMTVQEKVNVHAGFESVHPRQRYAGEEIRL